MIPLINEINKKDLYDKYVELYKITKELKKSDGYFKIIIDYLKGFESRISTNYKEVSHELIRVKEENEVLKSKLDNLKRVRKNG